MKNYKMQHKINNKDVHPKVTIIVPVYNGEKYIESCLDSIITQTLTDLEIIVIDDGSIDETPAILEDYSIKDRRVSIISQKNFGKPSIARNKGIKYSTGCYVTFLDSDDVYERNKIELESKLLDRFDAIDVVFSDMYLMTEDGVREDQSYLKRVGFLEKAYGFLTYIGDNSYRCSSSFYTFMSTQNTSLYTQTVMIRRSRLFQEPVWFPESLTIGEDVDLWFRLAKGSEMLYIDAPLACYRKNTTSITKNIEKYISGTIKVHTINYYRARESATKVELSQIARRISVNYFDLAYFYKESRSYSRAVSTYIKSLRWRLSARTASALLKTLVSWIAAIMRPQGREC